MPSRSRSSDRSMYDETRGRSASSSRYSASRSPDRSPSWQTRRARSYSPSPPGGYQDNCARRDSSGSSDNSVNYREHRRSGNRYENDEGHRPRGRRKRRVDSQEIHHDIHHDTQREIHRIGREHDPQSTFPYKRRRVIQVVRRVVVDPPRIHHKYPHVPKKHQSFWPPRTMFSVMQRRLNEFMQDDDEDNSRMLSLIQDIKELDAKFKRVCSGESLSDVFGHAKTAKMMALYIGLNGTLRPQLDLSSR